LSSPSAPSIGVPAAIASASSASIAAACGQVAGPVRIVARRLAAGLHDHRYVEIKVRGVRSALDGR
jgi:hypothetical protein